jgi:hypothetical protein
MTLEPDPIYAVTCPACLKVRNASRPIPPGAKVRCKCGQTFVPVPIEDVGVSDFPWLPVQPEDPVEGSQVVDQVAIDANEENPLSISDLESGLKEDRVGVEREATLTDLWQVLLTIADRLASLSPAAATAGEGKKEYKVITQKDKWFSGKFDPEKVEGALNGYAKQGWTMKGVATASVPGFGGQREEIVIIMER